MLYEVITVGAAVVGVGGVHAYVDNVGGPLEGPVADAGDTVWNENIGHTGIVEGCLSDVGYGVGDRIAARFAGRTRNNFV